MRPPCKDCPERHELCHATCEKYKAYRAKMEATYLWRLHLWSHKHEVAESNARRAKKK